MTGMTMRTENWCGHDIRFVEINGEWWAILKDICDALNLRTAKVAHRLDPDMLEKVKVEYSPKPPKRLRGKTDISEVPSRDVRSDHPSKGVRSRGNNKTRIMIAVNEIGIYEALFASKRLEARKFRRWSAGVMQKLRSSVGLEGYEVMRMADKDIQDNIDWILDSLYWDDEKKCVMQSVTVQGGDAEQIPFLD